MFGDTGEALLLASLVHIYLRHAHILLAQLGFQFLKCLPVLRSRVELTIQPLYNKARPCYMYVDI